MKKVTIGGNRLGSGKKQQVELHGYERSTHDLSYIWRSTMASGTLVPFMKLVGLPTDTFDINLDCSVLTHPTIGPLFGSYKVQLDIFSCDMRLYQAELHMNRLGIGMNMAGVKLPQVILEADRITTRKPIDNQQINSSCIFSYLGNRGIGQPKNALQLEAVREFNAIPYLAYWDIYKCYYANKQEEIGVVIHNDLEPTSAVFYKVVVTTVAGNIELTADEEGGFSGSHMVVPASRIEIQMSTYDEFDLNRLTFAWNGTLAMPANEVMGSWVFDEPNSTLIGSNPLITGMVNMGTYWLDNSISNLDDIEPKLVTFPLSNIDEMKLQLLQHEPGVRYKIEDTEIMPYGLPLYKRMEGGIVVGRSLLANQEGLAIKTYQSDLFNNWVNTDWIDGENGISAITSVNVTDGKFTIDEFNMKKKVYLMLNRIAISGGSYDDWIDAVYAGEKLSLTESPIYHGGLSKELIFQEVISNSATAEQPLGTLAGRGTMSSKHKGGEVTIKVDRHSYIMGIVSLTPRVDYSQGNDWDTNLKTMDDFHKPALDEIGFEELITDQMAWFDTQIDENGNVIYNSAGKVPAWINYMTAVNQVRGNFANANEQMFMVLNRRYDLEVTETGFRIKDLTTYIDPSKFNHIFAYTRRDAQNFWVQIRANVIARRKMSANIMPNL